MGLGFEAFRRFPAPGVSWCAQDPFPVTRNSTPHTLQDCHNRATYNVEERRELARELMAEMSATQTENARLRQELELVTGTNCSIREAAANQNRHNSRLEQALAELEVVNLAQRIQLGQF
ncbi:MAG: hypothetical protein GY696_38620, partial [Gammaproteobacteria bacterium]|nr:hypothetical protein [Gammaproteobacteria bacterium]